MSFSLHGDIEIRRRTDQTWEVIYLRHMSAAVGTQATSAEVRTQTEIGPSARGRTLPEALRFLVSMIEGKQSTGRGLDS